MQRKSSDVHGEEHPWIREARRAKDKGNFQIEDDGDEVQLPESPKPVPYWIPISAMCIMLLLAGISLRLAMVGQQGTPTDPTPVLHVWHHGSERETQALQNLATDFTQITGIPIVLSTYDPRTQSILTALYAKDGPDILIVDAILAEQLAHSNTLLTLDGRSPLYRTLAPQDYFLPLTPGADFTRPIGLVIPRRTRMVQTATQLIEHIRHASSS